MKSSTWSNDLMKLLFTNVAASKVGDAPGLQPAGTVGSLYVGLHTADPTAGGDQTSSEATFTGYARVAVARSGAGWTVAGAQISNTASVAFSLCTAGSETITHYSIGTDSAGAGKLLYSFPLVTTWYDLTAKDSSDTITAPGHALVVNDPVQFIRCVGGTIPGSVVVGTTYYVKTVSGNDLTISATVGGAQFDITSDGAALIGKLGSIAISPGITMSFAVGALTIAES